MRKKDFLWSVLAMVMAATMSMGLQSCDDDDDPELSIDKTFLSLKANGDGDKDISVTAEHTDWTASVIEGSAWLRVNKNGQLASVSVDANQTTETRDGKIKITATADASLTYEVKVSQFGTDGVITLSVSSLEFESEGGSQAIQVSSNAKWAVSGEPGWLTVSPKEVGAPTSGSESRSVTLTASANNTDKDRTCTLIFSTSDGKANTTLSIVQKKPKAEILVNGLTSTDLIFEGLFNGKSGIDFKQTVNVTSNASWNAAGVPDWLNVSPTNGNGTISMSIYPTSENQSSDDRKATIVLSAAGTEPTTIVVIQRGGLPPVTVTPANLVALYNQIGWELEAKGNVNKFNSICVTEAVYNKKTDKELLEDLQTDEANKFSDNYIFFHAYDSYGNQIKQNTTYYICTVAYDEKDNRGPIVKTKITTPSYANADDDAWVSFSDIGYNVSLGFQFTATKEGYCNTYHVIYGNLPSSYNYNSVLYAFEINYFIKNKKKHWFAQNWDLEIVTDYPNSHTFTHYTSTLSQYPLVVGYAWGVFQNGTVSSDLRGFSGDISESEARMKMTPRNSVENLKNMVVKQSEEVRRAKYFRK